jgi:hypothetical protein
LERIDEEFRRYLKISTFFIGEDQEQRGEKGLKDAKED